MIKLSGARGMSMARLPEIDEARLTLEQRKIYDEVTRVRGQVRGPFAIWLRNPELAECALKLQDLFASRVQLERRLVQLMILVSARLASAQFAWFVHEPHALKLGIAPEIVTAIRQRQTPNFVREDERLVYDVTLELNNTRTLSERTYQCGLEMFGEQRMVELVAAVGFYVMVAMTLNAFDAPVPGDLKPLAQDSEAARIRLILGSAALLCIVNWRGGIYYYNWEQLDVFLQRTTDTDGRTTERRWKIFGREFAETLNR
jgi:4-carboxymuconolactone decarboxylase